MKSVAGKIVDLFMKVEDVGRRLRRPGGNVGIVLDSD